MNDAIIEARELRKTFGRPMGIFVQPSATGVLVLVATVAVTLALVWAALLIAVRVTRAALRRAAAPGGLRTE
jgi:hypothetical protein